MEVLNMIEQKPRKVLKIDKKLKNIGAKIKIEK